VNLPLREDTAERYSATVTDRARKLLEDAKALSTEERAELAAELLASLPPNTAEELHPEWVVEIERRARRAWADPDGGEPWGEVEQRLFSRLRS
jgi:putative addiction module component (TIGR02574 family)